MSTFKPEEFYYGVIATEMVRFMIDVEGELEIMTLTGRHVFVGKGKWKHKGALFGAGKIECSLRYKEHLFEWQIRIYPLKERIHQENMWLSGRNGTFNHPTRPFSTYFDTTEIEIRENEA